MRHYYSMVRTLLFLVCTAFIFSSCMSDDTRILVFSKTAGYFHASIPDGVAALQQLGEENGFEVDTTTNAELFTEENLQNYATVVFLSTTGDVLNHTQEAEFERYIQSGGGFVGIHAAADTEYEWGWYGRLVGGYFSDHPGIRDPHPNVQEGTLDVVDKSHPSTEFLPDQWTRTDEWYSYRNMNEDVNVLMTIDEDSYQGGMDMGYHPMAWYHEYDGGRAFYTASGHTSESYEEELFLEHLLEGIRYAIGDDHRDYSRVRTQKVPAENRFTKTELVPGGVLVEPIEMTILPNLDVLIVERRGGVKLYKNESSTLTEAGHLDVYFETDLPGVNAEEGVIGIQKDPDFETNRFVYIFYSPSEESVNRLSRFRFEEDQLDMESETVVLEFYSQRDICCHTGGSIAFDSDGLMYVSTGDNSTPFDQRGQPYVLDGYAPLDERDGFEQYDARRSAGNSNDLRGKILRIRVNEDGSYDIPEGNLYPEGMEDTRPEIYVQGTRNPYRISVDPKTGYLYWGDVGPDADNDSLGVRGPRGYDEINQAREAGHYGWPYFIGDNYAYNEYDYATGTPGPVFDPENPINRSPHNTGLEELPPAKPAFIWYPYEVSQEFPQVGTGGRNAMAGPAYYTDLYPEETRLPDYYDGKLFIYEWIRDWIKVVTLRPNGDFDKMEPFMENTTFNAVMDMEVGPDGQLYLLEYGKGWFSKNPDSGLSRIDFNAGNRAPVVNSVRADKTSGLTPLEVEFTVDAEDPENDPMTYIWDVGNGETIETDEPTLQYTFDQIGDHEISVEVSDPDNLSEISNPISIYAGNTAPVVQIDIEGNRSFYFQDTPIDYNVSVEDEGPEGVSTSIDPSNLFVSADYVEAGDEEGEASTEGHQIVSNVMSGNNLAMTLDCRSCHLVSDSSIGPSYTSIAERYQDSTNAVTYLTDKIIQGSSGVWGETAMPAHRDMAEEDARKIVTWIRSLTDDEEVAESLPASGTLNPTLDNEPMVNGVLVLSASYTDEGGENVRSLTGNTSVILRNSLMNGAAASDLQEYNAVEFGGNTLLIAPNGPGSFRLEQIDLTGIGSVVLSSGSQQPLGYGYTFEFRLDAPDGELIGEGELAPGGDESPQGFLQQTLTVELNPVTDGEYHDVYIVSRPNDPDESVTPALISIQFIGE